MKVSEIMHDFDGEKYEMRFCSKQGCRACFGTDQSGEPNGYGCDDATKYADSRYQSILKRRLKKLEATNEH